DFHVTGVQTCALPISAPGGTGAEPPVPLLPSRGETSETSGTVAGCWGGVGLESTAEFSGARVAPGGAPCPASPLGATSPEEGARSEERRVGKECRTRG